MLQEYKKAILNFAKDEKAGKAEIETIWNLFYENNLTEKLTDAWGITSKSDAVVFSDKRWVAYERIGGILSAIHKEERSPNFRKDLIKYANTL